MIFYISDRPTSLSGEAKILWDKMGQVGQDLNPLFSIKTLSQLVPSWDKIGRFLVKAIAFGGNS